ncbi:hypothetical protein [Neoroseomonas soli]|uniref:Uncharacterized protein n=1 Tax=Neoroseomonas soli TaxID=1081025 RepID=A0A9X9X1Y6_9PROT|nr:hypothetical protein [Neoroseomonas soli]MBR0673415.1 hypothetical protein [Neoroseomonas soli]
MPRDPRRRDLLALTLACAGCEAVVRPPGPQAAVGVAEPEDETGQDRDGQALRRLRDDVVAALRRRGIDAAPGTAERPPLVLRLKVIQWNGPDLAPPAMHDGPLAIASLHERGWRRTRLAVVSHAPRDVATDRFAEAIADAVAPGILERGAPPAGSADITATGRRVRHLGDGVFLVGEDRVDLRAIAHSHDTIEDPDVPAATDVTLPDPAPGQDEATITLYQIDPPLTGLPSRQPGIDRSIDFRDPANLVKSTYANIVSVVRTEDPRPVPVASHPVGHFLVKVEVPGYPTILTGMTTIQRSDAELLNLTIGRELGIGGVLLTPQPGRLNTAAEVARELALRQRRLRVVDGLYFRPVRGRNTGPEHLLENGNVVFARVRVPLRNGTDALAHFVELIARGGHNRFGSLLNRTFKGTGSGCAAFAMSWLQASGVIPFVTEPPPGPPPTEPEALGPLEFWRASHSRVRIPWEHVGCDERVGAARAMAARYTLYDLLLHGERSSFVGAATEGLVDRIRSRFGLIGTTIFEAGIQTPLRGVAVLVYRRDPLDRGGYSWEGDGIDLSFWENARFSAWIRGLWQSGPRHPQVRLAREGRFLGVEINATGAPRQQEPFFAAVDRREEALRADRPRAETCEAAFAQGLE